MIWSLNTALRALSLGGLKGSASFSKLVARIEDCDTPVEGALAIREAALGVAVCSTGLLIRGRTVAVGAVLLSSFPLNGAMLGGLSDKVGDGSVEDFGEETGLDLTGDVGLAGGGGLLDSGEMGEGFLGSVAVDGLAITSVGLAVVRGRVGLGVEVVGAVVGGVEADIFGCESMCVNGDTVTVLTALTGASLLVDLRKADCKGFTLDVAAVGVGVVVVAFLYTKDEGLDGGRFQPWLSEVRAGASLALAALIEPEDREAAREASLLATLAVEKLELWGKAPNASLGLFLTS